MIKYRFYALKTGSFSTTCPVGPQEALDAILMFLGHRWWHSLSKRLRIGLGASVFRKKGKKMINCDFIGHRDKRR